MHLTPREIDKLQLLSLGDIAARRNQKGLKLNYPEAVAYITSATLDVADRYDVQVAIHTYHTEGAAVKPDHSNWNGDLRRR